MNSNTSLAQDISTLYNNWLATNFNEEMDTNPFQPILEDDMDIIHDFDMYDYLEESYEYSNAFDDEMFSEEPNIDLYSDDEEEFDFVE